MLQIKNLSKSFSNTPILNDVNFSLKLGEICAIVGNNGSGKTTFLKCLSGLMNFETGSIEFNSNGNPKQVRFQQTQRNSMSKQWFVKISRANPISHGGGHLWLPTGELIFLPDAYRVGCRGFLTFNVCVLRNFYDQFEANRANNLGVTAILISKVL